MGVGIEYDVVVIGAGPAGSAAARKAAQRGLRTLLLEKREMPRHKLCGGALSERAMSYLDLPVPQDLIDAECYGARVNFKNRTNQIRMRRRIAVLVSRERFDYWLAQKAIEAGAVIRVAEVKGLSPVPGGLMLETSQGSITSRTAIVAQGATGNLISMVRPLDDGSASGICLAHRFPLLSPDPFQDLSSLIDIYFGVAEFGYGWVFHHGSYYSVGIGGLRSLMSDPIVVFHDFCRQLGFDSQGVAPRGYLIPRGGIKRSLCADRILLAGDSAGFVDAFYGEGMAYAIRSGQLAADTLAFALQEGDTSMACLSRYQRTCRKHFERHLEYSLYLSKLMHRHPNVFLELLASSPSVLKMFLKVPMNVITYRFFLFWLIGQFPGMAAKRFILRGWPN